jgi:parallel beta-helix repeat protein
MRRNRRLSMKPMTRKTPTNLGWLWPILYGLAITLLVTVQPAFAKTSVATCQAITSPGAYELTADLVAVNTTCITITADNVTLFLNDHTITCVGGGFMGSCQQPGPFVGLGPTGIDIGPNVTGVAIMGLGTVDAFDTGIHVGDSNALIKRVKVTGPLCVSPFLCPRPDSTGILVEGSSGVNLLRNVVNNQSEGIDLHHVHCPGGSASCVLNGNVAHDNYSLPIPCHGIALHDTKGYTLTRNVAFANGENGLENAGIYLADGSTGNTITNNDSSNNLGFGIAASGAGTSGNVIVNNVALDNTFIPPIYADLGEVSGAGPNTWNDNNTCETETGTVPPTVCNPGEN